MALGNKLGLTSSADLAREEEPSARKGLLSFLKQAYSILFQQVNLQHCMQFISTSLRIFTTLPEKSAR